MLEINMTNKTRFEKITNFLILAVSIFLNHTNRNIGINISISDFFIVFLLFFLIIDDEFIIPISYSVFYLLLNIFLISTSIVYIPWKFQLSINYLNITKDFIKLLVSFLFFLLGYNLYSTGRVKYSLKWYSITAFLISITGLIFNVLSIHVFDELFYYGGSRFRGLMIDPNYYAVIQLTALPYFLKRGEYSLIKKILIYIFFFLFIVMSGSKTGIIIFIIYSAFLMVRQVLTDKLKFKHILILLTGMIGIILFIPILKESFFYMQNTLLTLFPISERVFLLFKDFNSAVKGGGSGRDTVWLDGIRIIKESPLLGVGFGTYIDLNKLLFNNRSVAHNTYIQIFAEWGLLFGIILFGMLLIYMLKATINFKKNKDNETIQIISDMMFILLLGSIGISLNNARIFWLLFGALIKGVKEN